MLSNSLPTAIILSAPDLSKKPNRLSNVGNKMFSAFTLGVDHPENGTTIYCSGYPSALFLVSGITLNLGPARSVQTHPAVLAPDEKFSVARLVNAGVMRA
jgi:hypothetical protein